MRLSRRCGRAVQTLFRLAMATAMAGGCPAVIAHAQDAANDGAPSDAEIARSIMTEPAARQTRRNCLASSDPGEIVVCAENADEYSVPSASTGSTDDGRLHAPDMAPAYPGPVVARGCFIPPCPKPPAYMVDFESLPEPPEGSDAERISNGELRAD
jgi:hypothetical protein